MAAVSGGRNPLIYAFAATWVLCLVVVAGADDWSQWRGPRRNSVSNEKGLASEWPKEGPRLLWQVKGIGFGYSTPSVVRGRIYLLSNDGADNEYVQALDARDGHRIWSTRLGKVGNPDQQPNYPGARSTPTVDGDVLYALGSDGDLACLALPDGAVRWRKALRADFGGKPGAWAYSESPLIDGNALICTPGGVAATIVALDKRTGATRWKCAVPGGDEAAYASAVISTGGGVRQVVQVLQNGLVGVDARTGRLYWRYNRVAANSPVNIPTPLADGDYVYTSGVRGGALLELKAAGGSVEVEQVYQTSRLPNAIGGAVKGGSYLYGAAGQMLLCVDFPTGALKWEARSIGAGSVCLADGRLYLHGENGEVAMVEATPNGYRELGRFTPPDQPKRGPSKAWAYPVISDGRLYVRDLDTLWCYDVKGAASR